MNDFYKYYYNSYWGVLIKDWHLFNNFIIGSHCFNYFCLNRNYLYFCLYLVQINCEIYFHYYYIKFNYLFNWFYNQFIDYIFYCSVENLKTNQMILFLAYFNYLDFFDYKFLAIHFFLHWNLLQRFLFLVVFPINLWFYSLHALGNWFISNQSNL